MARNIGFELASETSDIYGSWDSDIYCGENTLKELFLAFHKEGGDGVSMGHDLPQRIAENLKSLCMLFYRNRVFPDSYGEVQHDLLVRFNTEALARLFKTDFDTATGITGNLELMAEAIDAIDDPSIFQAFVYDFVPHAHTLVQPFLTNLGKRMYHPEVYTRIKQLRMLNPTTESYRLAKKDQRA